MIVIIFRGVLRKMSTFAMHVAKTGLNSQQLKMQVIANNLANVNTTGFKADRTNFESLLYQILRGAGENTSEDTSLTSGLSVGTGTRLLNTSKLYTQGSLINTGNSLDISRGRWFFQILLPDGRVGYTRSGVFSRNVSTVVTASGYTVHPEITPPEALSITVAADGIVSVQMPRRSKHKKQDNLHLRIFQIVRAYSPMAKVC